MAGTYKLIASNTLATTTTNVVFSNIPQTYTDLVLLVSSRETPAAPTTTFYLKFNSTTTGYFDTRIATDGATVWSNKNTGGSAMEIGVDSAATATANTFGSTEIYIPNYTSSTQKTVGAISVAETNSASLAGAGYAVMATSSRMSNTDAITSITIAGASFVSGSSFYLYGIESLEKTLGSSVKATGGTITTDGTYVIHKFASSGTFTPSANLTVEYLVVAGGGGAGSGGGGGGGLLTSAGLAVSSGVGLSVTVGAGGAAITNGNASSFSTFTTVGGGAGGSTNSPGSNGGSGGGAGARTTAGQGNKGLKTTGQGSDGGLTYRYTTNVGGAGGGGAGGTGQSIVDDSAGGYGGGGGYIGSSYTDTYGGGGGGGSYGGLNGTGQDGGGNGGGNPGLTNRGGGGGGGSNGSNSGGAGGSGAVIVRYPI